MKDNIFDLFLAISLGLSMVFLGTVFFILVLILYIPSLFSPKLQAGITDKVDNIRL